MSKHTQVQRATAALYGSRHRARACPQIPSLYWKPLQKNIHQLISSSEDQGQTVSVAKLTMDTVSTANFLTLDMCKMKANYNQMKSAGLENIISQGWRAVAGSLMQDLCPFRPISRKNEVCGLSLRLYSRGLFPPLCLPRNLSLHREHSSCPSWCLVLT